jgi:hypothetical protein
MAENESIHPSERFKHEIKEFVDREKRGRMIEKTGWGYYDSPLEFTDRPSDFSFERSFNRVIPPDAGNLRSYIESTVAPGAILLEYGGPARRLARGFSSEFLSRSAGITLFDQRTDDQRGDDNNQHHTIIPGDMFDPESKREVSAWLDGEKAGVIFERALGPTRYLPRDVAFLTQEVNDWYHHLAEDGHLFVQVPDDLAPLMRPWTTHINTEFAGSLQAQYAPHIILREPQVFRLTKLSGAPDSLPVLPAQTIRSLAVAGKFRRH